jgi:pseudaminic acid cytidylyltransferase
VKVAIIPARGGSKRIPRKNIKLFCGRPMISYSIEAAKKTGLFEKIIVSTDDEEIANIALKCGAEVPFMRPSELSCDNTPTAPVIAHALKYLLEAGFPVSSACCIYATAPFLASQDIINAGRIFKRKQDDFVFSATTFAFPVQRAITRSAKGKVIMLDKSKYFVRSQDLVEYFHDAGQFYWGTIEAWIQQRPFFSELSNFYEIPRWRVQDIDTEEDWTQAELMFPGVIARGCSGY